MIKKLKIDLLKLVFMIHAPMAVFSALALLRCFVKAGVNPARSD